jgi:hypothetical protein
VRSLSILVVVLAFLGSTPASAKGPALTWRIDPETPLIGEPASVEVLTWEWTPEGEPDTSRPSRTGLFDQEILRLPVRAYPASQFPHVGPGEPGISLGPLVRVSPSVYRGAITFPRPGNWVMTWRGYHPGAPDRPDWLVFRVRVGASTPTTWTDEGSDVSMAAKEARASIRPPWVAMAVGTGGIALAALALARRARRMPGSVRRAAHN